MVRTTASARNAVKSTRSATAGEKYLHWTREKKSKRDTVQSMRSCLLVASDYSKDHTDVSDVFKIGVQFDKFRSLPEPFVAGIKLAEKIVLGSAYGFSLSKLLTVMYPKLNLTLNQIVDALRKHILLDIITIKTYGQAYMCVRRDCDERIRVVYVNLALLLNMFDVAAETETSALYALFVAVKLARECANVLHYVLCGELRTSPDMLPPSLRYTLANKKSFTIDDLGDALEVDLFGGLVRMMEGDGGIANVTVKMGLKCLVLYPQLSARTGNVILPTQTFLATTQPQQELTEGAHCRLQTGEVVRKACAAVYAYRAAVCSRAVRTRTTVRKHPVWVKVPTKTKAAARVGMSYGLPIGLVRY